ncbi:MAG: hypothetical protein ACSLEW_08865, partial [Nocardioides sp.]
DPEEGEPNTEGGAHPGSPTNGPGFPDHSGDLPRHQCPETGHAHQLRRQNEAVGSRLIQHACSLNRHRGSALFQDRWTGGQGIEHSSLSRSYCTNRIGEDQMAVERARRTGLPVGAWEVLRTAARAAGTSAQGAVVHIVDRGGNLVFTDGTDLLDVDRPP